MGVMHGAGTAPATWTRRRWGRPAAFAGSRVRPPRPLERSVGDPSHSIPSSRCRAAALLLVLAVGACGGDNSSAPTSSSTTASPSTTSSTLLSAEQAAVFDAYLQCWKAYIEFGTEQTRSFTRADFDARVGGCLTGDQYTKQLHAFSNNRPLGVFFRGPPIEHDPRPEVELNGTVATVRDCMSDQGEVFDADDGRVLDRASGSRTLNVVTLSQVEGRWKIADTQEGGPCTA